MSESLYTTFWDGMAMIGRLLLSLRILLKKLLYSLKRALYRLKRALYPLKIILGWGGYDP